MNVVLTNGKSSLVQVMAWCRQATSHYLSQCWRRSLSPHGVPRPQWVIGIWPCYNMIYVLTILNIVIFKIISVTDDWGIPCEITLRWMLMDPTDDKSILVQIKPWCQAWSHCLSQCWPISMSTYGVTRQQWVDYWYMLFVHVPLNIEADIFKCILNISQTF